MNALNALSAPDLLTAATAATGMLPFIGTNLAGIQLVILFFFCDSHDIYESY